MKNKRFVTTPFILALLFSICQAHAQKPSFECSNVNKADEIAICSDERLAELDRLTTQAFIDVKSTLGIEKAREIGRPLLKRRAECMSDKLCIFDAQVSAMVEYDRVGVTIATPSDIKNYRRLIADGGSSPSTAHSNSGNLETAATRKLFSYLTPEQRAFIFNPKWFANAPNKTFTTMSKCTNCGVASASLLDKYVSISPSVHQWLRTYIKIDELKGYSVLNGLFILQAEGGPIEEISLRSDSLPLGQSNEFGLKLLKTTASGSHIKLVTICTGAKNVAASSVAEYANGAARVYDCTESQQTGSEPESIRHLTFTYFVDYGVFHATYWNEPRTRSEMKILSLN